MRGRNDIKSVSIRRKFQQNDIELTYLVAPRPLQSRWPRLASLALLPSLALETRGAHLPPVALRASSPAVSLGALGPIRAHFARSALSTSLARRPRLTLYTGNT